MSVDLDQEGSLYDDRSQPFIWIGNDAIDAGHIARMRPSGFTLYVILLRYRNANTRKTWPSLQRLQNDSGMSRRSIIEHRQRLVDLGYIIPVEGSNGREYRIADIFRNSGAMLSINDKPAKKQKQQTFEDTPGFVAFWAAWPKHQRKVDRGGCLKRWHQKGLEEKWQTIVAAVDAAKASADWLKNDGEFIPLPNTWLTQNRWEATITPQPLNGKHDPDTLFPGRAVTDEDREAAWGSDE